jgi:hypothetical protein
MNLSTSSVNSAAAVQFANGSEIVDFFEHIVRQHFIDWFNASCAGRQHWANKEISPDQEVRNRFLQIWNCIPLMFERRPINLLQFGALMSILINEVGKDLLPVSEICGRSDYPGLAYAFSDIPGVKASYNASENNKPAGDLFFVDDDYWTAHGARAGADLVRAIPNLREEWNGKTYPLNLFSTSLDPYHSGFIQQADFYKFRGRGLIQITWRSNYRSIVEFVQNYQGQNSVLLQYKAAWTGRDPDSVCTISTNEDWDTLFQRTNLIVPCRAIGLHNRASGNYLELATDAGVLTAMSPEPGSLYHMGLRINGSRSYASLFTQRVVQLLNTLNY